MLGLVGFTSFMAAVPLLLQQRHRRLTQGVPMAASERPLSTGEVRRGVYLNTGSKDVGPDPDWDFKAGECTGTRIALVELASIYSSALVRIPGTYKGKKPAIVDETTGLTPKGSPSMRSDR